MRPEDTFCQPTELTQRLASLSYPLVLANRVFDALHRGYVSYLRRASELGASLLVAVNTDASVRILGKGPYRPLISAEDRAYVLAGLYSVDLITFFDTRTPVELIGSIRSDIYVKGGEYNLETL